MKSFLEIKHTLEHEDTNSYSFDHYWEKAIYFFLKKDYSSLKDSLNHLSFEEIVEYLQEDSVVILSFISSSLNLDQIKELLILSQKKEKEFLIPVLAEAYGKIMHDSIGHKRKYSGEPYWVHLQEVQEIVKSVGGSYAMQAAAYLHDVVEDVKVEPNEIEKYFGLEIATLVEMLTDVSKPSDGNRKIRKQIDLDHTAKASPDAKTIKLADLISNSKSIVSQDPKFAQVYMKEKKALLEVLKEGNPQLYQQALSILNNYYK